MPAGEHPHDVAPAADGRGVWYTGQASGVLGLLDPATGRVERIPLGAGSAPHGVIVGPDGAPWVTDGGQNAIVRVDPASRAVARWPLAGPNVNLNTATFDRNVVLWFTGQAGYVGRLDPATTPAGTPIPVVPAPKGAGPYGIATSPDGQVWFASLAGSYLGHTLPAGNTFQIEVIEPPTPNQGARRVWSDSTGVLWVSEWNAGQVGRYDPRTKAWREWRLPGASPRTYAVYVDDHDVVWLTDFGANALVRFDPRAERFDSFPLPDANAAVRQLLGRPGQIWGAESGADKLVVITSC